jgi:hypothetical protein
MTWLLLIALVWVVLALPAALLLGRGLRLADRREEAARSTARVPDFIPADLLSSPSIQRRAA